MIDRVVSTPISTTIYFHTEKSIVNDALHFKIQSKGGQSWTFETPYPLNKEGTKWEAVWMDYTYLRKIIR